VNSLAARYPSWRKGFVAVYANTRAPDLRAAIAQTRERGSPAAGVSMTQSDHDRSLGRQSARQDRTNDDTFRS
jgi:hypothetical protein